MADTDREPEGGSYIITGSSGESASTRPGDSVSEGSTFSFADSFTGSGGSVDPQNRGASSGAYAEAPIGKKRRGRQPYPRDENGNIIRPDKANTGKSARLAKVVNNRQAIKAQIDTFFKLTAQFTRQPHWMLSDPEATLEAEVTCKLADAMEWDLSVGDSPLGAAVIFAVTTFTILKPRVDETVRIANAINVAPTRPATPGEARQQASRSNGGMGGIDFSADIAATVNNGDTLQ